ncbi:tumor necrosis factor receptor superfamily member 14-like isoform X4 [Sparus aurata]|uniref:tumor necrosis factor receptor superfamily member 14-like isoform X4 n=1 Tax=Sparus aurata TaxID=8175 RepID=UPI0011C0D94F|nr:tumor necrosis factor receptor superfamily member 14-like isoform X4 [Sparus aurata]
MRGKPALLPSLLLILVMNGFGGQTLKCHRSEYLTGSDCCPMCHAGNRVKTDCTETRSTSCLPCPEGTFMDRPTGLKQCFACGNCDAGSNLKISLSCTTTSDTVCEPLEGFFCLDSTENSCMAAQEHTRCKPGQYIRHKGTAQRDTECSDCSEGTYSDGTFTSCLSHTQCETLNLQVIKPGTVSTDAECGEQTANRTAVVVGVVVVVLFIVMIVAAPVMLLHIKKKGCLYTENKRNKENGNMVCFIPT